MILEVAIGKAVLAKHHMVYRRSTPWHHKGIKTDFSMEERNADDWEVVAFSYGTKGEYRNGND